MSLITDSLELQTRNLNAASYTLFLIENDELICGKHCYEDWFNKIKEKNHFIIDDMIESFNELELSDSPDTDKALDIVCTMYLIRCLENEELLEEKIHPEEVIFQITEQQIEEFSWLITITEMVYRKTLKIATKGKVKLKNINETKYSICE